MPVIDMSLNDLREYIAVVELDNEVAVKRFYKLEDKQQYKLHPENEKYEFVYLR